MGGFKEGLLNKAPNQRHGASVVQTRSVGVRKRLAVVMMIKLAPRRRAWGGHTLLTGATTTVRSRTIAQGGLSEHACFFRVHPLVARRVTHSRYSSSTVRESQASKAKSDEPAANSKQAHTEHAGAAHTFGV